VKYTMAEALDEMRHLHDVDTGRLRGLEVAYHLDDVTGLDTLPEPWRGRLTGLLADRAAGTITAGTPQYLVFSDGLLVACATVHATVVTPNLPGMSPIQARHQRQAAAILADLDRDTLRKLADDRDHRDTPHRTDTDTRQTTPGALRVAPATDPTNTRWIRIGADLDTARSAVARAVGGSPHDAVIVTAVGYGHHGDHTHRPNLAVLCAMHTVTAAHPVSLATVGNWIDDEQGLAGQADPHLLAAQFTDAYIGRFASHRHYVEHHMQQLGWTDLLRTNGLEPYFEHHRFERHLFTHEVTAIDVDSWQPGHGIEVFGRRRTT
jgi:hypothetical protein